jgi:hypothetical protein
MKTRIIALSFALAGLAEVSGAGPLTAVEPRASEALMHTRQAIAEGKAGRAAGLEEHAKRAFDIASSMPTDTHMDEAARHLSATVAEARTGDTASGVAHAVEAERHLEEAAG